MNQTYCSQIAINHYSQNTLVMKANRYIIVICMLFLFSISQAQQEVLYTQYVFSQLAVNPACAGNDDGLSLTALSRKQWFGLQGSPTSFSFIGQGLVNNKKSECRSLSGKCLSPLENKQVGLGVVVFNDRVGVSNTLISSIAYSYKIQFSHGRRISLGLQGSMLNYSQSFNQLDNPNTSDPVFVDNVQVLRFNAGGGVFYETNHYYLGFSVPQILENSLNPNSKEDKTLRQYFFTGGYVFYLNRFYKFKPTFMARYTNGLPVQFDINANLLYRDKLWLGCSYRYTNSLNMFLELLISDSFRMGVAYDYPINEVNKVAHGSAELMINYTFLKSKKRISNPRYF
jgi:type IX secretion system PorP/SprF family membrane protein